MNKTENEILVITQEECAEVIQAISKVLRFGLKDVYNSQSNGDRLEEEIGDLVCMFKLMEEKGLINWFSVLEYSSKKREKLKVWSTVFGE